MSTDRLLSAVEGLLFVADRPMLASELRQQLGPAEVSLEAVAVCLGQLAERHALKDGRGFYLARVGEAWQLRTTPEAVPYVAPVVGARPERLSRAALETLSIIAYRQPCTRAEIERIRGVDSGGVVRALLDRKLLAIAGRRAEPGRPMVYRTSRRFLEQFGLASLDQLPNLREFTELEAEDLAGTPPHVGDAASRDQLTLQEYAARRAIEHLDAEVDRRLAERLEESP